MRSTSHIMDDYCRHFFLLYQVWEDKVSQVQAKKMLEQDIFLLGIHFGRWDEFDQLVQRALIAESIAHIRIYDNAANQLRMIDYWTDVVLEELNDALHNSTPSMGITDMTHHLRSWQLCCNMAHLSKITPQQHSAVAHSFIEIADMFLMYGGSMTTNTMQLMKEFEASLGVE